MLFAGSAWQTILNVVTAILSSVNNAFQLSGRLKTARQSKWFPRIALGLSLIAVAVMSWFAHDWLSTRKPAPPVVASVGAPKSAQVSPGTPGASESAVSSKLQQPTHCSRSRHQETASGGSQARSSTTANNAPNGFAISGGSVNSPIINNNYGEPKGVGNLAERARDLAHGMMVNMAERGWQPPDEHVDLPPGDTPFLHFPAQTESADYRNTWFNNMRFSWRSHFGTSVIEVHDEFALLHLKDRDLDSFVQSYELEENNLSRGLVREPLDPVNPFVIQEVAKSLVRLADQLNPVVGTQVGSPTQP